MKKVYILILFFIVASMGLHATTYTSAQNGSWLTPTTWSPTGVPIPGDIVIINHAVTLDTDFAYTVGSITVNIPGSLIQDATGRDIWLNGINASLTNNGITDIRYLLLSAGSCSNGGDFSVKSFANYIVVNNTGAILGADSLYNDGTINNNGSIEVSTFYNDNTITNDGFIVGNGSAVVDSMFNAGTFNNNVGALLKADSCTNSNMFTNDGVINFDQYTNTGTFTNTNYMSFVDMTNTGTYTNQDSLIGAGSVTNTGIFNNQAGARFDLAVSFLNADVVNFDAVFNANGRFVVGDSFYNFDGIAGSAPGSIQVQDTSYNHTTGTMTGTFDFCDLTPPFTPIKIDFNLGTVAPTITYCVITTVSEAKENVEMIVYPNPTVGVVNIASAGDIMIDVYNVLGEKLMTTTNTQIDLSDYQNGVYLLLLKDEKGNLIKQERIVKH